MTSGAVPNLPDEVVEAQAPPLHLWSASPRDGRGRRHGTSRSAPFDRWFRYPAGFATDYVEHLLSRVSLEPGDRVVDCFAGSGVTGTASRAAGLGFVGVEAHPMVAELANAKLQLQAERPQLTTAAERLRQMVSIHSPEETAFTVPELISKSFDATQLRTLLALRDAICEHPEAPEYVYLKWALLGTLRDVAVVKVGWPYQRPSQARRPRYTLTLERFCERVSWMAEDIAGVVDDDHERFVVAGDSRDEEIWARGLGDGALRACVSSPPYLNNFDYADATRLEAYFWGSAATWADLCSVIRVDMLTATTQQSSRREETAGLAALQDSAAAPDVASLVAELKQQRRSRERGKEYDQVLPAYLSALRDILRNLSRHLEPKAPVLWLIGDSAPYGVYIDTPRLIGKLASDFGFDIRADVVLRERGNRWSGAPGRHQERLAERLLVMSVP